VFQFLKSSGIVDEIRLKIDKREGIRKPPVETEGEPILKKTYTTKNENFITNQMIRETKVRSMRHLKFFLVLR